MSVGTSQISMIECDSTSNKAKTAVSEFIGDDVEANLLVLDSNHTHEHVLAELRLWSPLLQQGNYIIVSDTIVESIPEQKHRPRPWGPGNNPMTGMQEFLSENDRFSSSNKFTDRAFASFNPSGYLICTK